MAATLQAGAVAINMVGKDGQFQQTINQSAKSIKNFQKTVGLTKFPGFKNPAALVRDFAVTFAALDHTARRVWNTFKSAVTEFSDFGNSIAKMSRSTGIGAKDLSLLGYAAEQCGSRHRQ